MLCENTGNSMNRRGLRNKESSARLKLIKAGLKKRYVKERVFSFFGLTAILTAMAMLAILFVSITGKGYTAFKQTFVRIEITFDADMIDPEHTGDPEVISQGDYGGLVKKSLRQMFPDVKKRREKRDLYSLVSSGAAYQLRKMVLADPAMIGTTQNVWVPADDDVDMLMKGHIKERKGRS